MRKIISFDCFHWNVIKIYWLSREQCLSLLVMLHANAEVQTDVENIKPWYDHYWDKWEREGCGKQVNWLQKDLE